MFKALGLFRFLFYEQNLTSYANVSVLVRIDLHSRGDIILHRYRFRLTVFRDFHKTPCSWLKIRLNDSLNPFTVSGSTMKLINRVANHATAIPVLKTPSKLMKDPR